MMYREIKPHAHLAPYVRCFWYMERDYSAPGAHEVVWPDGKTELLFIAGAQYYQDGKPLPTAMLIGPLTHPVTLTAPGVLRLVGVRFHPWGFWPFCQTPVSTLRDRIIPYADELRDELAALPLAAAVSLLESHLLRQVKTEPHPLVTPLARAISEAEGALPIAELERRSGVSGRHLERLFNEVVGLTPKKLSVILRFDKARLALFWNPRADLTEVAHQLGYYDHSHFVRDFRAHFGMSPAAFKEWMAHQRTTLDPAPQVEFLQEEPS